MASNLSEADQASIATARAAALEQAEVAFARLDLDGNGEVDREEIMKLAESGQGLPDGASQEAKEAKIKEFLDSFDQNGDGKIQKSEWLAFFGNLFDSVIEAGLSQWVSTQSLPLNWRLEAGEWLERRHSLGQAEDVLECNVLAAVPLAAILLSRDSHDQGPSLSQRQDDSKPAL